MATFARKELINQVALKAHSFGITPENPGKMEVGSEYVSINGKQYPKSYQESLKALHREIAGVKDFAQPAKVQKI